MNLRIKMLLPFLLLLSIFLAVSTLYVIPKYGEEVKRDVIEHEATYLRMIALGLTPKLVSNDLSTLSAITQQVMAEHRHWHSIELLTPDAPAPILLSSSRANLDNDLETLTQDLVLQGNKYGSLQLKLDLTNLIEQHMGHVKHFRKAAIGILLFSMLVVSLFLDRMIRKPLTRLSDFATQITEGDYEHRYTRQSNDEIGQLGSLLDGMRQKVLERDQSMRRISEIQDAARLIQSKLMLGEDKQQVYGTIQARILSLSESETGLICEIVEDDNRITCLSPLSLNHTLSQPPSSWRVNIYPERSLLGEVMRTGRSVIKNHGEFSNEELGFPIPDSVTPFNFMGLPLYNSYRLVGVLCLVNREQHFNAPLIKELEILMQPLSGLITAYQERTILTESEARLRLLIDNAAEGIITTSENGSITTFNPAAERIFGYSKSHVLGRSVGILVPRDKLKVYFGQLQPIFEQQHLPHPLSNNELEATGMHRNGKMIPLELSVTQIKTQQGMQYTGIVRDISDRKQQEAELNKAYSDLQKAHELMEEQSRRDSLTKLANRRFLDQILAREWARAERTGTNELSIILCDIDYFKKYNDTYGHLEGDDCLRNVAKALAESFARKIDLVARYGGEEFMIVLPDTSQASAIEMAEAMRQKVWDLNLIHESSPVANRITISVGIFTGGPATSHNLNSAIQRADKSLYQAKASGRNRVMHCCNLPLVHTENHG